MTIRKINDIPSYTFLSANQGAVAGNWGKINWLKYFIRKDGKTQRERKEKVPFSNKFLIKLNEGKWKDEYIHYTSVLIDLDENKLELGAEIFLQGTPEDPDFLRIASAIYLDMLRVGDDAAKDREAVKEI